MAAQVGISLPGCQDTVRHGLARALAVAAVREAYEEAGLFCGAVVPSGVMGDQFLETPIFELQPPARSC